MHVPISIEDLKLFFSGAKKHKCYKDTLDLHEDLKVHADGLFPKKLIEERRPSESESTLEYRKKIYQPITKKPIGKVIGSLSKIRRSPDWSIKYDKAAFPSRVVEAENIEQYCEKSYPGHTSVTNWVFSVLLKNQCVDANAVIAVLPQNIEAGQKNEYYKPVATVFNSEQVIYFEDGAEYAILKSTDKSDLIKDDGSTAYQAGKVFLVITTTEYQKWEEKSDGGYERTGYLLHNKKALPVFKVKAQFLKQKDNSTIQESRLSLMLPYLNDAAREYSDLQAAKVQHMFPLFWYVVSKECNNCKGTGLVPTAQGPQGCQHCYDENLKQSTGKIKFSPYAHLQVDAAKLGQQAMPVPPAGYVGRDVEIIKHQEESVKAHLFDALAAINMQFLDQTPLNISGEAKNVDREELNNFVYSIAEDIVYVMDKVYWWICEWRYATIIPDAAARTAMLPEITVPEQFDLLPADYLMDDISKARTAKINPLLLATMEEDFAVKKFYNNPELSGLIKAYFELDPLPGLTVDEKMSMLTNKGISQEQYVISSNVVSFVRRAVEENKDFLSQKLSDKKATLLAYAKEIIKMNDEAEKLKQEMLLDQQVALSKTEPVLN